MAPKLELVRIKWPGRAAVLQAMGDDDALTAELATNYADYHRHLVALSHKAGPRPEPSALAHDPDRYFEACALQQEIQIAEAILREALVSSGRTVASATDGPGEVPLADRRGRLVSATDGAISADDPGYPAPSSPPPGPIGPEESR